MYRRKSVEDLRESLLQRRINDTEHNKYNNLRTLIVSGDFKRFKSLLSLSNSEEDFNINMKTSFKGATFLELAFNKAVDPKYNLSIAEELLNAGAEITDQCRLNMEKNKRLGDFIEDYLSRQDPSNSVSVVTAEKTLEKSPKCCVIS